MAVHGNVAQEIGVGYRKYLETEWERESYS